MVSVLSVSYTHLDVYKRQVILLQFFIFQAFLIEQDTKILFCFSLLGPFFHVYIINMLRILSISTNPIKVFGRCVLGEKEVTYQFNQFQLQLSCVGAVMDFIVRRQWVLGLAVLTVLPSKFNSQLF